MLKQIFISIVLGISLLGLACSEDYDPFNEITKLRVLAIKAEPPALTSGQRTEISALVSAPTDAEVTYKWSWCPLTAGGVDGYNCAVDEQQLRDILDGFFPGGSALLPSFDLGTLPSARFDYTMPPELIEGLCNLTISDFVPSFTVAPSCEETFDITVRLEVSDSEKTVVAVKNVTLHLTDDIIPNSNPSIDRVFATDDTGFEKELADGMESSIAERVDHALFTQVPESASEEFVIPPSNENPEPEMDRETLFMTWFVTGGETRYQRTSYIYDDIDFDVLGSNRWKTPKIDNHNKGAATLFLVLQDERGGVTWTIRELILEER